MRPQELAQRIHAGPTKNRFSISAVDRHVVADKITCSATNEFRPQSLDKLAPRDEVSNLVFEVDNDVLHLL